MTDIPERIQKLLPIRVIVRLNDGVISMIEGKTELSMGMGWDTGRINMFWSGKAHSIIGEFQMDGVEWARGNLDKQKNNEFMMDPTAEDCPIQIDWTRWIAALDGTDKYAKRNAFFVVKPHGLWQMCALVAERRLKSANEGLVYTQKQLDLAEEKLAKIEAVMHPPKPEEDTDD